MTLQLLALCFASGCAGAVVGVLLLFKLSKPRARLTIDLVLLKDPVCPACETKLGTKTFFAPVAKGTDTFDITLKR